MGEIADLFEANDLEPVIDIELPPEKKFESRVPISKAKIQPAYTILHRLTLSEMENQLLLLVLEQDIKSLKTQALSILAKRFDIESIEKAKEENLSFNIKETLEVEVLKKRDE